MSASEGKISKVTKSESGDVAKERLIDRCLTVCSETYRPRDGSPSETSTTTVKIFVRFLGDLTEEQIASGFSYHMKHSEWFPTPAEIRRAALGETKSAVEARGIISSVEAERFWNEVIDYAAQYGNALGPRPNLELSLGEHGHAIAAGVRACGGIDRIESCPQHELQWLRKTFLETYSKFRREAQARAELAEIPPEIKAIAEKKALP